MPLYDYECPKCKTKGEFLVHVDEIKRCPKCGGGMTRLFHANYGINMGASGAYGYYDENLQCFINSNHQRREEMKKQGVSEGFGKGWK